MCLEDERCNTQAVDMCLQKFHAAGLHGLSLQLAIDVLMVLSRMIV